ncbi:glycosyltransferase family 2 protein [Microcoleus sp. FACHB-1515]|uniref:glycosyltransferase family 2 protein n=1 Tax=Cyanophyceae TaxID=3028117 RepID=UPI001685CA14|nr:glycosyltransferase family 2 protein [Microcoleus sp. FACHB-1515]MBD2092821.1 glycosyltransferase family 2 protein [Microcoleus sp. FACHB-1515]
MPKVSIALCTYNGASYIIEQLQSFEQQTRLPDEIVICDDCSQDNTVERIQAFAKTAKIPIHLHRNDKNLGYSQNFCQTISLTSGDIIFLSDQDDVWHESKVDKFLQAFERNDAIAVLSDAHLVDEKLKSLGQTLWQLNSFDRSAQAFMLSPEGFELTLQRGNIWCGSSMALRRSIAEIGLPVPIGCPHDLWFGMIAVALGKASLVPEPLNDYRQHQQQASGQKKPGFFNTVQTLNRKLQFFRSTVMYERWLFEHQALRDRLQQITKYPINPDVLKLLDAKIAYLQAQNQLRQRPFFLRPPILYQELVSGRYAKFSRGWKHLVVDLLL